MKFIKEKTNIDFLGKRKRNLAFAVSGMILLFGIFNIFTKGFHYGIDFNGGNRFLIKFVLEKPPLDKIRSMIKEKYDVIPEITTFGKVENQEISITIEKLADVDGKQLSIEVARLFKKHAENGDLPAFEIRQSEAVGSKVGAELKTKGYQAVMFTLIAILGYITFRFHWRYGLGAIAALFHDVLITLGIFSFFELEVSLSIIAAVLTIVGYSLNDTIVVFDRIRENTAKLPKKSLLDIINLSVNESLSRTVLTSLTTSFVVISLITFGSEITLGFSIALMIGIIVGTYSSIFIASPVLILLKSGTLDFFRKPALVDK